MNCSDICPQTIRELAKNICPSAQSSERQLVKSLFSSGASHFVTTHIKSKLHPVSNAAFFNYRPGVPDALYDDNGQRILIECKRFVQINQMNSVSSIQTNGCEVRNGLLQLLEYCIFYGERNGILIVFDCIGQQVDSKTRSLVSQFTDFYGVEVHMIWISSNPQYYTFI